MVRCWGPRQQIDSVGRWFHHVSVTWRHVMASARRRWIDLRHGRSTSHLRPRPRRLLSPTDRPTSAASYPSHLPHTHTHTHTRARATGLWKCQTMSPGLQPLSVSLSAGLLLCDHTTAPHSLRYWLLMLIIISCRSRHRTSCWQEVSEIRGTVSNLWVSASGSWDTRTTKRHICLVSRRPGPQDFWAYCRTARSTAFIPADQCLDSEV